MIYLIDLEYVETRYTAQWKTEFPQALADKTGTDVTIIEGLPQDNDVSSGTFLDFSATNIYKSQQVQKIAEIFKAGDVKDGDHFVFADAWHPGIINLKYMADLQNIIIKTHGLWHAGSYDPQDFLGRILNNKPWVRNSEYAFFDAYDKNYFATQFHINLFASTMFPGPEYEDYLLDKIVRTGWPFEYLENIIRNDTIGVEKDMPPKAKDLILFPHRNAPEKQLDIFKDLEKHLPQYRFVNCAELDLKKQDYHRLLGQAKIVFSANLQETLGISCYEIFLAGGFPLVPDRLSYSEMYLPEFKYPSEWTLSMDDYQSNKEYLKDRIIHLMENFNTNDLKAAADINKNSLSRDYFSAGNLYTELTNE